MHQLITFVLLALCSGGVTAEDNILLNPDDGLPADNYQLDITTSDFNTRIQEERVIPRDVILVLDNSGSMKNNDPDFLVRQAVLEFIRRQDERTHIGIIIFDQTVRMPVKLTSASLQNREKILNGIETIQYEGLLTDSPAAIERAIYDLKNSGRPDAQKNIIFMTDGIIDTGVPEKDLQKSKWLREDLALDAADNGIRIFGIAFTEKADFELIQSIAQKTKGEYYRATRVNDLPDVFERINAIINTSTEPELDATTPVSAADTPPAPIIIDIPAQPSDQEERIRSIMIIALVIILAIILLAILVLLIRHNRTLDNKEDNNMQEAYIIDLSLTTEKQTYKLSHKPTMFGRVAGQDVDAKNYIVVPESTIGRRHAIIEYKDYTFWIIDQGSINGTFVNGEAVSAECRLKHGDRIKLHKYEFEFIVPEMEDSGLTQVANTVLAKQQGIDESEAITHISARHTQTKSQHEDSSHPDDDATISPKN